MAAWNASEACGKSPLWNRAAPRPSRLSRRRLGSLSAARFEPDPVFGLAIPKAVDGVPGSVLRPWESWPARAAYDAAAAKLAGMFAENFKQYADGVSEEIRAAGPRV